MTDGMVILGTVGIVGLVAVTTIALVYNRSLWVKGNSSELEVQANATKEAEELQRHISTQPQ